MIGYQPIRQGVRGTGTTAEVFAHFILSIVDSVQERSVLLQNNNLSFDNERFVLWDNLSVHLSPLV